MIRNGVVLLLMGLAWLLAAGAASASMRMPQPMDPFVVEAADGAFSLRVIPSDKYGAGPAEYVWSANGAELGRDEHPWTLRSPVVTSNGHAFGFAYTAGEPAKGGFREGHGETVFAAIDAEGAVLWQIAEERSYGEFVPLDSSPGPTVRWFLNVPETESIVAAVFRWSNDGKAIQEWWRIDAATGEREASRPEAFQKFWPSQAVPVPGTPLLAFHVIRGVEDDSIFRVADQNGAVVWEQTLPDDYESNYREAPEEAAIYRRIRSDGAIRTDAGDGTFRAYHHRDGELVTWNVENTNGEWTVTRAGSESWKALAEQPESNAESLPHITEAFTELEPVALQAVAEIPERRMTDYCPGLAGEFGVILYGGEESPVAELWNDQGEVLFSEPLPVSGKTPGLFGSRIAHVRGSEYLIALTAYGTGRIVRVRFGDGPPEIIETPQLADIESFAALPDGRFVVQEDVRKRYTTSSYLIFFSASGEELWRLRERHTNTNRTLPMPEDICVSNGEIVMLGNPSDIIDRYDTKGNLLARVDLDETWQPDPGYLTDIEPDGVGGFFVYDFNTEKPLVHVGRDGTILSRSELRDEEGTPFRGIVKVAPDGTRWSTIDDQLVQLDDNAQVVRRLGGELQPGRLGRIAASAFRPNGDVVAVDQHTKDVFVFRADGELIRIHETDEDSVAAKAGPTTLRCPEDGTIWLSHGSLFFRREEQWAVFPTDSDAAGRGSEKIQNTYFTPVPGTGGRWLTAYDQIALRTARDAEPVLIERHPGGTWFSGILAMPSADDSLLVASRDRVTLFAADGTALWETANVPATPFANGTFITPEKIVVAYGNSVRILDATDGSLIGAWSLGEGTGAPYVMAVGLFGDELRLMTSGDHAQVRRFRMN